MSACSSSKNAKKTESLLTSTEWKMMSVKANNDAELLIPPVEKVPTLKIDADGKASGFAGCNRFNGPVTLNGNGINFGNLAATMMFCAETMNVETAFMQALREVDTYTIENGTLYLKKGADILVVLN